MISPLEVEDLLYEFDDLIQSLDAYVHHYSIAESVLFDNFSHRALVLNDFMHYCVTKGVKHLKASYLLAVEGFGEDSLILIRSAYEAYISLCCAIELPDLAIDSFVFDKIALKSNRSRYLRTKSGRVDFRKIIDEKSGDQRDSPPSIEKIVSLIGNSIDQDLHREIYNFLSEHSHVHMIGSGNYRKGAKYSTELDCQVNSAIMFGVYFSILLLDRSLVIEDIDDDERVRCESEIIDSSWRLTRFIISEEISDGVKEKLLYKLEDIRENLSENT